MVNISTSDNHTLMKHLDKIKIGNYEINQPFLFCPEGFPSSYSTHKFKIDTFKPYNLPHTVDQSIYWEYLLIVLHVDDLDDQINLDFSNMYMLIKTCGVDMMSRCDYLDLNKIYPLECENLFDEETTQLLKAMIRNKNNIALKNILFFPFKTIRCGSLFLSNLTENFQINIWLNNLAPHCTGCDIYVKYQLHDTEQFDVITDTMFL